MAYAAILGFGTVGGGVWEILQRNQALLARRAGDPVQVKYVLVRRHPADRPGTPQPCFIQDINVILDDPAVTVVAECIGGTKAAYPYVKACLSRGKSVCTSNKELVAAYGSELLALAREKGCAFLFEASVGGGMPLLAPLYQSLSAGQVHTVQGIVNGTTNFMLTKMEREGMAFDDALKLAQSLGYAETVDPGDDVDGRDACRKLAILASLLSGRQIPVSQIPTRGIRGLTRQDMADARRLHCSVKLIAHAHVDADGQVTAGVEPMLVPQDDLLSSVEDVFNGLRAESDTAGESFFYGRGAGQLPTASAVVADMLDAIQYGAAVHSRLFWTDADPARPVRTDAGPGAYYVRAEGVTAAGLAEALPDAAFTLLDETAVFAENITPAQLAVLHRAAEKAGGRLACVLRRLKR